MKKRFLIGIAAVCAAIAIALTVAMSDEEDDSPASNGPVWQVGAEPPERFARRWARMVATAERRRDCRELKLVERRSSMRLGCPADRRLRASMRRFRVVAAKPYGTGAVVDYKSGRAPEGAALILHAGPDRQWGIAQVGVLTPPSVGTDDGRSREAFDATAAAYLESVRTRDCKRFDALALSAGDGKGCSDSFRATEEFARRLREDRGAAPRYEGGNAHFGFYTLETKRPEPVSVTIAVVRDRVDDGSEERAVLGIAPAPTRAQRRAAIAAGRRQLWLQRQGGKRAQRSQTGKRAD